MSSKEEQALLEASAYLSSRQNKLKDSKLKLETLVKEFYEDLDLIKEKDQQINELQSEVDILLHEIQESEDKKEQFKIEFTLSITKQKELEDRALQIGKRIHQLELDKGQVEFQISQIGISELENGKLKKLESEVNELELELKKMNVSKNKAMVLLKQVYEELKKQHQEIKDKMINEYQESEDTLNELRANKADLQSKIKKLDDKFLVYKEKNDCQIKEWQYECPEFAEDDALIKKLNDDLNMINNEVEKLEADMNIFRKKEDERVGLIRKLEMKIKELMIQGEKDYYLEYEEYNSNKETIQQLKNQVLEFNELNNQYEEKLNQKQSEYKDPNFEEIYQEKLKDLAEQYSGQINEKRKILEELNSQNKLLSTKINKKENHVQRLRENIQQIASNLEITYKYHKKQKHLNHKLLIQKKQYEGQLISFDKATAPTEENHAKFIVNKTQQILNSMKAIQSEINMQKKEEEEIESEKQRLQKENNLMKKFLMSYDKIKALNHKYKDKQKAMEESRPVRDQPATLVFHCRNATLSAVTKGD